MDAGTLPRRLKAAREALGLTQVFVAERLGIARPLIAYWESGQRDVPIRSLEQLADLYGIQSWLFNEEDEADFDLAVAFRARGLSESDKEDLARIKKLALTLDHIHQLEETRRQ